MNNILKYLLAFILLNNCSLDTKSGIWTEKKDTKTVKIEKENVTQVFIKDEILEKEFNSNLRLKLSSSSISI